MPTPVIVTGGAGFIGSELIRQLDHDGYEVHNLDILTYAGDLTRLTTCSSTTHHRVDICDYEQVSKIINEVQPEAIFHLAAESHVDRSIDQPTAFIDTNVTGTLILLQAAHAYWKTSSADQQHNFRFIHISTDEVYGSLGFEDPAFTEKSQYLPNSPYAASKAASDHLVRSWWKTFKFPTITTHCSNNYGPWQFPEKLIPLMISKALKGDTLPVYGDGSNIRDWIHVQDHVHALRLIWEKSPVGEVWNIGGECEISNLTLVKEICNQLDQRRDSSQSYQDQIQFVSDRPGHDLRYAIELDKIQNMLGWSPSISFDQGLKDTIQWYIDHQQWVQDTINRGQYAKQDRLGKG